MNTQTQEALKMAIEAMEMAMEADWELNASHVFNILHSITVCKEALATEQVREEDSRVRQNDVQPAQEPVAWISVKDRLPKEIGRYLVYVEEIYDLGNAHYIWNAGFNPNDGIFQEETMKGATVTHWMNLPNTPNGISHYVNPTHLAPHPAQEPVLLNVKTHDDKTYKVEVSAPSCQECENLKHDLEGYMDANKELINREWQGLSDECLDEIVFNCGLSATAKDIVRAIEQALKEKNT